VKKEFDLRVALDESLALLAHQMTLQKVTIHRQYQPDVPHVHGSREMLQQVFTNLALNACNAMPEGGTLTIDVQSALSGQVEIRFSDTGRGIAPEHLLKIFDPFFTTMPVGKGVGLGLSISHSIVQQFQGTIDVKSQIGKGSTFIVRLPGKARSS
jgi:signal transduction histidine kinase